MNRLPREFSVSGLPFPAPRSVSSVAPHTLLWLPEMAVLRGLHVKVILMDCHPHRPLGLLGRPDLASGFQKCQQTQDTI